ncbi:MAG TPA: MotA/TolQ/ExbB proton channel family protein [Gammaproteobacteria bacterium]|nr:MotA/TolQ/ExbB proton channel family protein [Gammaproteobacteria bacterium]
MKLIRIIGSGLLVATFATGTVWAQDDAAGQQEESAAEQATTIDALIGLIEQGTSADTATHRERMQQFRQNLANQQQLLEQARAERVRQEQIGDDLNTEFDANELLIIDVTAQLNERLGSLRELFGVLQQFAGDARSAFEVSPTNIEFPDREQWLTDFADRMSGTSVLPTVGEIERLWFELAREASELGKVKRLPNQRIITADGEEINEDIVRVGAFNLVADGRYLRHVTDTNSVRELQRQPAEARFVGSTSELLAAQPGDGFVRFGIDVTRGQLLSLLIQYPDQMEQIRQGGTPGYIIIALGILGVLLAIERLITLTIIGRKVKSQLKSDTPKKNNPLGRVLLVYEENKHADTETLELKLGEAILREQPPLQRGILFIKIISVVAPLLGLLGTVVGMIQTFQAIMLFGAGDATRMAGGISQALQTTRFGLIVAIPMVLLHTIVNGRARRIQQILQEQSAGIVAAQSEKTR